MKRVLMLLAVAFCFCLTSVAQTPGTSGQSTTTTKTSKTKTSKSAASQESSSTSTRAAKSSQLTGCVSGPNPEGVYLLTNGRHRKGVEIGGNDELKNHVGHQVKLTGSWASAKAIGETEQAEKNAANAEKNEKGEKGEKNEAAERHFKVDSITMVSDTCPASKNGASAGAAKPKSGKKSSSAAPSGSAPAAPPTK